MTATFILGAGFSRAVSSSMPLLTELGLRLLAGDDVLAERVGPHEIVQLESWMSQVASSQPYRTSAENVEAKGLYLRAARQISEVLRDEVLSTTGRALPGWLHELAEIWHATRATVSTFNYDTLVEIAARRARLYDPEARSIIPWPTVINFAPGGHAGLTFGEQGRDATWRSFRLLKLHGSINWYWVPGDDTNATLERVPLYDAEQGEELAYDADRWVPGKEPYIVPPVALKSSFYGGAITSHLWGKASESLRHADEVVLMGYSVPLTDLTTLGLLRESLARKTRVQLTICDLDPDAVLERLSSVVQPGVDVETEVFSGPDAIEQFTKSRVARVRDATLKAVRAMLEERPDAPLAAPAGERQLRRVSSIHQSGSVAICQVTDPFYAGADSSEEGVSARELLSALRGVDHLAIDADDARRTVWGAYVQPEGENDWLVLAAGIGD